MSNVITGQSLHVMMLDVEHRLLAGLNDSIKNFTSAETKLLEGLHGATFQSVYDLVQTTGFHCTEYDKLVNSTNTQIADNLTVGEFTFRRYIHYEQHTKPVGKTVSSSVSVRATLMSTVGSGFYIQRVNWYTDGVLQQDHDYNNTDYTNFLKKSQTNKRYNATKANLNKLEEKRKNLESKCLIYEEYLKTL
jgi:hypothetical protein